MPQPVSGAASAYFWAAVESPHDVEGPGPGPASATAAVRERGGGAEGERQREERGCRPSAGE